MEPMGIFLWPRPFRPGSYKEQMEISMELQLMEVMHRRMASKVVGLFSK